MHGPRYLTLFLSFLVVFYAGFAVMIYVQLAHFSMLVDEIHDHSMVVTKGALTAHRNVVRMSRDIKEMILVSNLDEQRARLMRIEQDGHDAEQNIALVLERIDGEEGKVLVRQAIDLIHAQKLLRGQITTKIFAGDVQGAQVLTSTEGRQVMKQLEEVMAKISNYADAQSVGFHVESVTTLKRAQVVLFSAGLIVLIVSIIFATLAWRSLRTSREHAHLVVHGARNEELVKEMKNLSRLLNETLKKNAGR